MGSNLLYPCFLTNVNLSLCNQVTIPSGVREKFGLEEGDKILFFTTEHGIVLRKIGVPTLEEFEKMVEESDSKVELSLEEISDIVHEHREVKE